ARARGTLSVQFLSGARRLSCDAAGNTPPYSPGALHSRKKRPAPCESDRSAKLQSGRPRRSKITTARDGGKESAPSSRAPPRAARHAFPKLAANGPFRGDGLTDAIGPFETLGSRPSACA